MQNMKDTAIETMPMMSPVCTELREGGKEGREECEIKVERGEDNLKCYLLNKCGLYIYVSIYT